MWISKTTLRTYVSCSKDVGWFTHPTPTYSNALIQLLNFRVGGFSGTCPPTHTTHPDHSSQTAYFLIPFDFTK
jgi:hypothetical protein